MLLNIAIILLILWLIGWIALPAVGGLIHLLLVIAIIVIVVHLLRGK